ncbi:MAG: hypothetical protein LBS21_09345 [Clostridiales bacterium]|jgi:hypothetical protein|nr:hypothetical protein [Clostridiales bacterium]
MKFFTAPKFKIPFNNVLVYICACVITLGCLGIFYRLCFSGMVTELSALQSRKAELESDLAAKESNLAALNENMRFTETYGETALPRFITPADENEALVSLSLLIKNCDLTESEFNIMPREYLSDGLYLRPVRLSVAGSYNACMEFLRQIQRGDYYFMPGSVEMNSPTEEVVNLGAGMYIIVFDETALLQDGAEEFASPNDSSIEQYGAEVSSSNDSSIEQYGAENSTSNAANGERTGENERNPFLFGQ